MAKKEKENKKLSKEQKKALKEQEKQQQMRMNVLQERLPIREIKERLYVTADGQYFPVFSFGQKAIDLMSLDEVYSFAKQLEATFESLDMYQIQFLLLPVPFDLAPYKQNLEFRRKELKDEKERIEYELTNRSENLTAKDKKNLLDKLDQIKYSLIYLDNQQAHTSFFLQSGKVANKHCYIIPCSKDRWNIITVQEMARIVEQALKSLTPESHRCSQEEMEKILVEVYNPLRPEIYINY